MSTEKFKNRIKFYMVGVGIGLVASYFFFGSRGCEWLPGNRVKNMIAEKEILIGDSIKFLMECHGVDESDVYGLLDDEGDVEFDQSETHKQPMEYHIEGEKNNRDIWIRYALGDSTVEVIDFEYKSGNDCQTSQSNTRKTTVPLPFDDVIRIIESKEMRITDVAKCQMDCFDLTRKEVEEFHLGEKTFVQESEPRLIPNPYYILRGINSKGDFSIKYEIGDNRTRVTWIGINDSDVQCDCQSIF